MPSNTYHIHIEGLVQGVGFRPFVYNLAKEFGLCGWVNNTSDGVHLQFNADENIAQEFYDSIIINAPSISKITGHTITKTDPQKFTCFEIVESKAEAEPDLMLTPDFAMCTVCQEELCNSINHRFHYPFITCTQCGPRYSIIRSLPYDRQVTSMNIFQMCMECNQEYYLPENRRHYSQTNSCAHCAITMEMYDASGTKLFADNAIIINEITRKLNDGNIIAVKAIGGYLLLCDANNSPSIKTLRERKHRPSKPFALMFPTIESIKQLTDLETCEEEAIRSFAAPVVLVNFKENCKGFLCTNDIAPGLSKLGVMLPYTPLFHLLIEKFSKPLIATSANISDAPIIYNDRDALKYLPAVADFVIINNREIIIPQDDSVLQFAQLSKQRITIRRSRGMAPSFFNYDCKSDETIFATGALLKSSFTFVTKGKIFISQYLGNTEYYEAQESYSKTVQHFFNLFNKEPEVILTDKHPLYFSHSFAKKLAEELKITAKEIQHHKAHFAGVLAENKLMQRGTHQQIKLTMQQPILGVIWDGTGLGDDGNIWGGEFFSYENNAISRLCHFDYFPFILGDKMAREPRISALAACADVVMEDDLLRSKFTETEWNLYRKILKQYTVTFPLSENKGLLQCSSLGRIFDAVASLLNICDRQSYEGEAAMLLQEQAQLYFNQNGWDGISSYFKEDISYSHIPTTSMMQEIVNDIQRKKSPQFISAKFHYSLVHLVDILASNFGLNKIAFSGGVFLNSLLVDLLRYHLSNKYQLYFHVELSPNDENISFGQMVYYDNNIDDLKKIDKEKMSRQAF